MVGPWIQFVPAGAVPCLDSEDETLISGNFSSETVNAIVETKGSKTIEIQSDQSGGAGSFVLTQQIFDGARSEWKNQSSTFQPSGTTLFRISVVFTGLVTFKAVVRRIKPCKV